MNLEDLRARLRNNIADSDTATSDSWTDAQLNQYLHEAASHVQDVLTGLDQAYLEEEADTVMGASDTEITLPTGFKTLIDMRRIDSNLNKKFDIVSRREVPESIDDFTYRYQAYMLKGKIRYVTPLNEAHTTRLVYVKELATIADGASWNLPRSAETLLIVQATIEVLASEGINNTKWDKVYSLKRQDLEGNKFRQRATPRYVRYIG